MGLNDPELMRIIEMMNNCQFLLGIHLNDNNITKCKYNEENNDYDYEDTFYDATGEFFIHEEDLVAINRSRKPLIKDMRNKVFNSQFR